VRFAGDDLAAFFLPDLRDGLLEGMTFFKLTIR
jgi:hypothetical protein